MRRLGMWAVVLVLYLALILSLGIYAAAGGGMTGATYVGVRYEGEEFFYNPGVTLDYEFGESDLHLTFDVSTQYDLSKTIHEQQLRYDLSLNYYPGFWLLRGFAVTLGGVYAGDRPQPVWYLEIARPFQ